MGILDQTNYFDPQSAGILSGAGSYLANAGPSYSPVSTSSAFGHGLLGAQQGMNNAHELNLRYALASGTLSIEQLKLIQGMRQLAMQEAALKQSGLDLPGMPGGFNAPGILSGAYTAPTQSGATQGTPQAGALNAPSTASGGTPNAFSNLPPWARQAATLDIAMTGGKNLHSIIGEANKITALRPGAPGVNASGQMVFPPTPITPPGQQLSLTPGGGWQASDVPGAAAGAARYAAAVSGAQAGATAPYQTDPVTQASGAVVPTFKPQIPGYPGAASPPPAAAPPGPIPGAAISTGKPLTIQAPDDATAQAWMKQLETQGVQANVTVAPKRGAPIPTSEVTGPWENIPKVQAPAGIGQTTYQKTLDTDRANTVTRMSGANSAQADAANQRMALNNQALELVDKADTGPLSAHIATVKNWLVSNFHFDESHFENTPSATIALQKDLTNSATQKAKQQFGSRITQNEVMLMLNKAAPNIDMTKAAIKYLILTDNAQGKYQIQKAEDFGKYVQQGGDPMRFEGWYAKSFPLNDVMNKLKMFPDAPSIGDAMTHSAGIQFGKYKFPNQEALDAYKKAGGM